jgi:hypothetical protein
MKDRDGIEYVLEMDDGRLVTLVQNRESDEQPLPDGARVPVQLNGQYTRVMAHPAVDYNAGGGGLGRPRQRRHCASTKCRARRRRSGREEPSAPGQRRGRAAGQARAVDQHHRFRPAAVSGHYGPYRGKRPECPPGGAQLARRQRRARSAAGQERTGRSLKGR